ncbi:(2Fe-2S)-binding protein [Streptomyces benahoarensis]|uniref:(2Fe-2S)-binding protein n=1 Tax=Streptomyces benahoarensis TaxID=2595054 RepID=A0A553ZCN2_9ACTN|nr:(2Fe-2S)-binding protein [Streptomyces benahoarensis]TSB21081.1 (2Fe-2S)-binding protein [Streptomyces benahoarensis]TSB39200.1 (2Fe-2S)-binding protein [Streptomyces benahoarensis]
MPSALATSAPASPLSGAYAQLTEVFPSLRVTEADAALPDGDGWVGAAALATGGEGLDTFLAWDDAQVQRDYGTRARPDVVASFALHRYAWPACLLITLPWFLHRRVPSLPVADVAFHREQGRMAVRVRSFACLPGDPAAELPGARVVPDEEALRGAVREAVAGHLGPVLNGFRGRMRRGPRALWGMASDEIVEGLWYLGHLLGEERRAVAELERLLPGATAPYVGSAAFRELTGPGGEALPTRDRASCCMFYTLRPEDTCVTCPRTCDTDRVARLTATA